MIQILKCIRVRFTWLNHDIMIREMYAWHEYLKKVTDKGSGYLNEV